MNRRFFAPVNKRRIPGSLNRAGALLVLGLVAFATFVGVFSAIRPVPTSAAASTTLTFQARLLNTSGSLVPDGTYNVEFKIYDTVGSGASAQGVCSLDSSTDDCWWLETRTGANKVTVKNGYVYANLGSVTAFSSTIPWDQELWITMNIGGTGAPSWDGEMSPRFKVTAVPYSFIAGRALSVASNNTNAASTHSATVSVTTGNAAGATSNSGNLTVDTGTATGTTGTITIAAANASALTLGRAGLTTTNSGALTVTELLAANGGFTLQAGDTLTVNGDAFTDLTGTGLAVSSGALQFDYTATIGADPALAASLTIFGTTGLIFEGTGVDGFETLLNTTNPTADRTVTLPNATGTIALLSGTQTFTGATTFTTDTNLTYAGTENLAVTSDLAGTVDVISVIGTPSASAGTTTGFALSQANSANSNGLDTGILIANLDTDLAITDAISLTSAGGGFTNILNTPTIDITGAGAISGATTLGLSGAISGATATDTINGLIINAGALSGISTISTSSTINSQTISSAANFTGTVTIQGSSALTLGVTGTSTGSIGFKGATAASGTINLVGQTNPTGTRTITLPDETGTVCTTGSICSGYASAAGYATISLNNIASTNLSAALNVTSGNLSLQTTTSGNINLTPAVGTGLVNILTGNLQVGDGVPGVTLNGEDVYIEGTLEVDGAQQFDGSSTFSAAGTAVNVTNNASIGGTLTVNTIQLSGACCGVGINFNNENVAGLNTVTISDSGAGEGLQWADASWSVDNSPLDRSNATGNFNIYGTTNNIALWRPALFVQNATNYATATPGTNGTLTFTTSGAGDIVFNQGGNVGVGDTTPASLFTVGSGDLFQVNSSGQVVAGSITSGFGAIDIGADTITSGLINGQTISSAANFTGTVTIQGASALTLGVTGTSTGSIGFKGATAASGTINLVGQTNPTGTRTITLPDETGTVCTTGSICSGYVAATAGFIQGGNSFSATATLGTNDSNTLAFETNNLTQASIAVGGATTFQNTTNSAAAFSVKASDTNTILNVNSSVQQVSVGTAGSAKFSVGTGSYVTALFNQTGTSDILQLQDNGVNVFTVADGGKVTIAGTVQDVSTGSSLYVNADMTSTTNSQYGIRSAPNVLPGSASGTSYIAVLGQNDSASANITSATLVGVNGGNYYSGTGTVGSSIGLQSTFTNTTTGTITSNRGISVSNPNNAGGGTITTNYGIYVSGQTAGATDYGIYIADADSYSLFLASTDGDAASGITFASDTNLYRSVADTLRTDDALIIGRNNAANTLQLASTAAGVGLTIGGDTNLYRSAADTLRTNDALTVDGLFTGVLGATISGATINLNASSNFGTNINTGTSNGAVAIGNSAAGAITLQSASTIGLTGTSTITGLSAGAGTALTINNSTSTGSIFVAQDNGTAVVSVADGGGVIFRNSTNSTTGFQIQNSAGTTNNLTVDTTNGRVGINTATPDAKLDVEGTDGTELVRLSNTTTGDSSGVFSGSGSPEGVVTAQIGSLYTDTTYGKVYKKGSGDGTNTGWEEFAAGSGFNGAKLSRAAAQSISNTTVTKIAFDTEEYDVGGIGDPTTNDRFDIKKAGKYLLTANYVTGGLDSGEAAYAYIYKNGVELTNNFSLSSGADQGGSVNVSTTLDLAVNDYIELYVWHNEGAAQNTLTGSTKTFMTVSQLDAAGGGNPEVGVKVYNDANQSVLHGTPTALTFNQERYDTSAMHSTSSNTSRLVAPTMGKYLIVCNASWSAHATGVRELGIRLNGGNMIAMVDDIPGTASYVFRQTVTALYQLAAGDYVECVEYQDSGTTLTISSSANHSPEFAMSKIDGGVNSTLQAAYNSGNTLTTTDARDVSISLADTTTDSNFILNVATGSTSKFGVQYNGADTFSISNAASAQGSALFKNATNNTTAFMIQNSTGTPLVTVDTTNKKLTVATDIIATAAATATTGTTEATARTNVTTVTLTAAGSFANNDIIFLNNAGQDYYTRIVSGGGTTTLTVSPAVSYDVSTAVTKYTVQNIGATTTDYATNANKFFQGYFLGGVVTGAGSTTLSDGALNSTGNLVLQSTSGNVGIGTGTTAPSYKLTVKSGGATTAAIKIEQSGNTDGWGLVPNHNNGSLHFERFGGGAGTHLTLTNAGALTISSTLTVSGATGSINGSNIITAASSEHITGVKYFKSNKGSGTYLGSNNTYQLEAYSDDGGAAAMSFHRGGAFAINFGLDPDNVLRIGGWSASSNRWQLDSSGNNTIAGQLYTAGGNAGHYFDKTNDQCLGGAGDDTWLRLTVTCANGSAYTDLAIDNLWAAGAGRFDIAEYTPVKESDHLIPGDIVSSDPDKDTQLRRSRAAYDPTVFGIVSSEFSAGMVIGGNGPEAYLTDKSALPIALGGRVLVKVSTENGNISRGDAITTSSINGTGMKITKTGPIVGKSMDIFDPSLMTCIPTPTAEGAPWLPFEDPALNPNGIPKNECFVLPDGTYLSRITVFVTPSWYVPDQQLLAELNVSGLARLSTLTVTGAATFEGAVTVVGDAEFQGNLKVLGDTEVANITVNGKIITAGDTPTVVLGATTTGDGSSYTIEGNDTAGSITVTTGTATLANPLAAGEQAVLTFVTPFTTTPRITLTPTTEAAGNISYYITKSGAEFKLHFTEAPQPNSTYSFDYQVIQ